MDIVKTIPERSYAKGDDVANMIFPDAQMRKVFEGVRDVKEIPDSRAIVDSTTRRTFSIVKRGYKMERHESVITKCDEIRAQFPEWGTAVREVWLSNYGGRMKLRDTFVEQKFEIAPGDIVNPTMEVAASYDTSLAQFFMVGGFRAFCLNGLVIGKILGRYKRKHTASLSLDDAKGIIVEGMANYSDATNLWSALAQRDALPKEVVAYEALGFSKVEQLAIETNIKREGEVIQWDNEDKEKRNVKINAWELMNILTYETSHNIEDITRRDKVAQNIAQVFVH